MYDITSAGVLVTSPKGRVLCVERSDGRGLGLPFGKVEDEDATVACTAIRECREETGYVVAPLDTGAPFVSDGRACFRSVIAGRTLPSHDEGSVKWVTPERFLKRASHPEYAEDLFRYFGLLPPPTWIPVTDGYPPEGEEVLIRHRSYGGMGFSRAHQQYRLKDPEWGYFCRKQAGEDLNAEEWQAVQDINIDDPSNYVPFRWVVNLGDWKTTSVAMRDVTHWMRPG